MNARATSDFKFVADKIAFFTLLIGFFIAPIFFIPSVLVSLSSAKTFLIGIIFVVAKVLWIIARLKAGRIEYPTHPVFYLLCGDSGMVHHFRSSFAVMVIVALWPRF